MSMKDTIKVSEIPFDAIAEVLAVANQLLDPKDEGNAKAVQSSKDLLAFVNEVRQDPIEEMKRELLESLSLDSYDLRRYKDYTLEQLCEHGVHDIIEAKRDSIKESYGEVLESIKRSADEALEM